MKPTLPEDREMDEQSAEVSRRYRETASEEPSVRVDRAILEAARREAGRPVIVRNWQVPAAVAAVLVIGVSLSLLTREGLEPLPPLDQSGSRAEVAKPAAPSLAMKAELAPKAKVDLRSRPERDRSERAEAFVGRSAGAPQSSVPEAAAPAPSPVPRFDAPDATAPASSGKEPSENASALSAEEGSLRERGAAPGVQQEMPAAEKKALADATVEGRAKSLRKEESEAAVALAAKESPEQRLRSIESMIREGRQADARLQLAEFRKRYPGYRLPEALLAFEREAAPAPK